MQVDPLMESTANVSGYAFGADNPVFFNDPLGLRNKHQQQGPSNNADYSSFWDGMMEVLLNDRFSVNHWTPGGGFDDEGGGGNASDNFPDDANYKILDEVKIKADVGGWKKNLQNLLDNEGPGPKHPKNILTNNIYVNALFNMRTPTKFKGDLLGFGIGPGFSKGPVKLDLKIGISINGEGMRTKASVSGSIYGFGVNAEEVYNMDNGNLSSMVEATSIGFDKKSWSIDLLFLQTYGDYKAATGYIKELGETIQNYFSSLFSQWTNPNHP
jgi:hypothetical protein